MQEAPFPLTKTPPSPETDAGSQKPACRRTFLRFAGALGAAAFAGACKGGGDARAQETAVEFFSREHGVIRRVLLVMEEAKGGLDARMDLSPEIFRGAAGILRQFLVGHHQKIEEQHVYPLLEASENHAKLVSVCREQHRACEALLDIVDELTLGPSLKDIEKRRTLGVAVHQLARTHRAHAAREDTVLYPALFELLSAARIQQLNAAVGKIERESVGPKGYGEILQMVSQLEAALGMDDLASFTPNLDEFTE